VVLSDQNIFKIKVVLGVSKLISSALTLNYFES
jgi:hypothetical protein